MGTGMESELARVQNTENQIMQQDIKSTVVDVTEIMQDSCQVLTAAAISPSRVICTGWAVAASPIARATVKNFLRPGRGKKPISAPWPN